MKCEVSQRNDVKLKLLSHGNKPAPDTTFRRAFSLVSLIVLHTKHVSIF